MEVASAIIKTITDIVYKGQHYCYETHTIFNPPCVEENTWIYLTQPFLNLAWRRQDSREYYPIFIVSKSVSQPTSISYKGLGWFFKLNIVAKYNIFI
jgi:hypothetical protein